MQDFDALLLSRQEADTLRAVCLPDGAANKNWSVKPGCAAGGGGSRRSASPPRLLIAEVEANDPGDLRAADAGAADRQGRRL